MIQVLKLLWGLGSSSAIGVNIGTSTFEGIENIEGSNGQDITVTVR